MDKTPMKFTLNFVFLFFLELAHHEFAKNPAEN